MLNPKPFLFLAAVVAPTSLIALRQTEWLPLNAQPDMGHASSPATQDVTKNTSTYSITASVTDLDTFQNNLDLTQTTRLPGHEGDVSVATNLSNNIISTNRSFDPSTGKREVTYVIQNNSYLLDQGDVGYVVYNFWGVDNMSDSARHDNNTLNSQCVVALKYVSPPAPPPGKGGN